MTGFLLAALSTSTAYQMYIAFNAASGEEPKDSDAFLYIALDMAQWLSVIGLLIMYFTGQLS
jgi:hypothetical protein